MIKDDLINLLPDFFQNILEYPEIMKAYGGALQTAENNAEALKNNLFVQTCDVVTLQYWENLLNIEVPSGATIDDRRDAVLTALNSGQIVTRRGFYSLATNVFGRGWGIVYVPPRPTDVWVDPAVDFSTTDTPTLNMSVSNYPVWRYAMRMFKNMWTRFAPAHVHLKIMQWTFVNIRGNLYVGGVCSIRVCSKLKAE